MSGRGLSTTEEAASADNQVNGLQKTQIVDADNQVVGTDTNPLVTKSDAEEAMLENQQKEFGAWDYKAGVSGTVIVTGGMRVVGIAAHSSADGSMSINGGDSVPIPSTVGINIEPKGNLVDPTILLIGTDTYFIELVK